MARVYSMLWLFSLFPLVSPQDSFHPDNIHSLLADTYPDNSTTQQIENDAAPLTTTVASIPFSNDQRVNLNWNLADFDLIEYHIRRNLNHNFSPCSDFFRFTCDPNSIGNHSVAAISEAYYQEILLSTSPLDPTQIDNDVLKMQMDNSTDFSSIEYSMALTERCASNQSCFADEFKLTYRVYKFLRLNSTLLLQGFNETLAESASPEKLEHLTTQLHQAINRVTDLKSALLFYEGVRGRNIIMERLAGRRESIGSVLVKTRQLAIELAQTLLEKFNRTAWLHTTTLYNLPTFVQFSTILSNLTLRTDLDEGFDFNSTAQDILLHQYLSYYNCSREKGLSDLGSSLYSTKFSLLYATSQLSSQLRREGRRELLFRLSHPFHFASGNVDEGIVLTAPFFFPLATNLRTEHLFGSIGTDIARELVYRFVHPKFTRRSAEYAAEYEGITEHFEASCEVFGERYCSQLRAHVQEYVAELEGVSLAYELMSRTMDDDGLQAQPYPDLPFTTRQLFFIAHSVSLCRDVQQLRTQASRRVDAFVRVNGALSQMPEFAQAFGCEKDDPMSAQ